MTAPAIVGFRLPEGPRAADDDLRAVITVEFGALLIAGVKLCQNPGGDYFIKTPQPATKGARIVFRGGPERDALVTRAATMLHAMAPHRPAVTPLATAPEFLEPSQ